MQLEEMQRSGMSKQHLFTALRSKEIMNLGKVKRVYFEACGIPSIYQEEKEKPGLQILPVRILEV
jgi:uncharacterized membrane protein YcaP (DUF421 family)